MKNTFGKKFGRLVTNYQKARRAYPVETLSYLKHHLWSRHLKILDLGCGTGIATRQMAKFGHVIGADPDAAMLRVAKRHSRIQDENYVRATARRLPWSNASFDAVTAFSAFHWFTDPKSIAEIKRVLKPGSIFFVANKNGVRSWGAGYRNVIMQAIHRPVADFIKTTDYDPKKILARHGFKKIRVRTWKKSEFYSLKNALEYVQSTSIWNSVPPRLRLRALTSLKAFFQATLRKRGKIERRLNVRVVIGTK